MQEKAQKMLTNGLDKTQIITELNKEYPAQAVIAWINRNRK
jgi:hypothetical protein